MAVSRGGALRLAALAALAAGALGAVAPAAAQGLSPQQLVASTFEKYDNSFQDVERAVAQFRKRQFDACRDSLAKAREAHPQLPPPDTLMTILFLGVKQADRARKSLDAAAVNHPRDPEAYLLMADLALRARNLIAAQLGYQMALQLVEPLETTERRKFSLEARATAGLASLCEAREQFDQAAGHLRAWQQLDADNPVPVGSLGRVLFMQGKYDEAEQQFEKLEEMDENAPPVEIAMGRLYASHGKSKQAERQMTAAAKDHPDDVRTLLTVAEWSVGAGRLPQAEAHLKHVLELEPGSVTARVLQARIHRQSGDEAAAAELLQEAILRAPNRFAVSNELARTLAMSEDEQKRRIGLDYARRNFQLYGKRANKFAGEAAFTYAWLLHRAGRGDDAEAALLSLPSGSSISNENAYYAAQIYAARGKSAMALNAVQAALGSKTQFPGREQAEAMRNKLLKQAEGVAASDQ